MPVGKLNELKVGSATKDIQYMEALMSEIAKAKIPAPCPIEQRWTSGSRALMSPVNGGFCETSACALYSMYSHCLYVPCQWWVV